MQSNNANKILQIITDFFVIALKVIMLVFLIGFVALSVGEMFSLMGEAWGFFSIFWFGTIALWSYNKHMSDVSDPLQLLEGIAAVILQFLAISVLTFFVAIISEVLRSSFNDMVGWIFFVSVNSLIILSCTDIIKWTKESI